MTTRNTKRYSTKQKCYSSLQEFFKSTPIVGLNTIDYEGYPLDVLLDETVGANTLIVSFSPAVTNSNVTRPYFVGAGIFSSLLAHKLYLSDPSLELHDDIRLAWFAGNRKQPSLGRDLSKLISHVATELNVKNLIFVGTSGGGYASLLYSLKFPGSLAFVVNPQTDILKYHKQHVSPYTRYAWGMTFENAIRLLPRRTTTSVVQQYADGSDNTVLWLQSATDSHHIEHHMLPLLRKINRPCDMRIVIGEGWGPGHHPAPREMQIELLEAAITVDGHWGRLWDMFPQFETIGEAIEKYAKPS